MEKYSSIEQLKNVVKTVRDYCKKNGIVTHPTITFQGTVKLHGTNGSVVFKNDGTVDFQSRERVLSLLSDNAGFCAFGERNINDLRKTKEAVDAAGFSYEKLVIFGEWCGTGVQKGVGISKIGKKIFVAFNVTLIDSQGNRKEILPDQIKSLLYRTDDIYCIYDFPTWEIDIDFSNPELSQNKLIELTLEVEKECPVAKELLKRFSGSVVSMNNVDLIGEGIVWTNFVYNLKFKIKGEKHSASKVSTLKEISPVGIERMNSISEFVEKVVSENRLLQGFSKLREMGLDIQMENLGTYIKWVVSDSITEEKDVVLSSGFAVKEIAPKISEKAKKYWFANYEKEQ